MALNILQIILFLTTSCPESSIHLSNLQELRLKRQSSGLFPHRVESSLSCLFCIGALPDSMCLHWSPSCYDAEYLQESQELKTRQILWPCTSCFVWGHSAQGTLSAVLERTCSEDWAQDSLMQSRTKARVISPVWLCISVVSLVLHTWSKAVLGGAFYNSEIQTHHCSEFRIPSLLLRSMTPSDSHSLVKTSRAFSLC